jgi:hypothetical protein
MISYVVQRGDERRRNVYAVWTSVRDSPDGGRNGHADRNRDVLVRGVVVSSAGRGLGGRVALTGDELVPTGTVVLFEESVFETVPTLRS